jgi:predicted amidohydrolase
MKKSVVIFMFTFCCVVLHTVAQNDDDSQIGKLVVASCQFPISSSITENYEWIKSQMLEAKLKKADVVHFAECALSGYPEVDLKTLEGFEWKLLYEKTDSILSLAQQLNIWVVLGSIHRLSEGVKPHNSLYVINSNGEIVDRYDKRFCTGGDLKHFSPGDHFVNFEINGLNCGLLICYDVRFPELFREYRKLDTDILFHSFYNARQKKGSIHPVIMPITAQTRAATNYFYISLTNSSATESWPCHFITPDGLIKNKLPKNIPGILISEVDLSKKYYDASRKYRSNAINGILNSGETIEDQHSKNRIGIIKQ